MKLLNTLPNTDELLTIEKLVWCLDDFHYKTFVRLLTEQNAKLSVKLITTIKERQHNGQWGNLAEVVYGSNEQKQRQTLNQLASHTFKLTSYLAINYPGYLMPNITFILQALNNGYVENANFYVEIVYDVARKTEDFTMLKFVLQFKQQQAYLVKEIGKGIKLHQELMEVLDHEHLLNKIHFNLRKNFNVNSEKTFSSEQVQEYLEFFTANLQSSFNTVSLLSRYALLYVKYYFIPAEFFTPQTLEEIKTFESEFHLHSYLIFPPLLDLQSNVNFLKLNSSFINLDTTEGKKDYQLMQQHYNKVEYWKNYVNIPEIFSLTVKATFYLSKYSHKIHSLNAVDVDKDREDIEAVKLRCIEMLAKPIMREKIYVNDHLNLTVTYAGTLLLGDASDIKKATEVLEDLLFAYQQVNITASLDSIFVCLMMGYFALKENEVCAKTFVRYSKLAKGKPIYEDNDLVIHILYYLSQWLETGRKQYLNKLHRCKKQSLEKDYLHDSRKLIHQFEIDYKVQFDTDEESIQ